jgi:protein-disulfide isomerase
MTSPHAIPIAILVGGIIVAGAVYLSVAGPSKPSIPGQGNPSLVRPVGTADHILGNPAAPIMIIEYSDFDCEHCKNFEDAMHRVIADAGADGKIAWVFRQFPLTELHPNAMKHAQAAECVAIAGGNAAFWTFADALFANQPVDPSRYGALAASAGVPSDAFTTCYTDAANTVDEHINIDRKNALDSGAVGTPYSLIVVKGKTPIVMDGGYTYDAIELIINNELAQL